MTSLPEWDQGACHAQPKLTHLFYSDKPEDQRQAKALCFECPIQVQCLEYAIQTQEKFGIWGGLLPAERKRINARLYRLGS